MKQAYETLSSHKDKEVSALPALNDFPWNLKINKVEASLANETVEKLQHNVEALQVAVQNMDDELGRLRAEAKLFKINKVEAEQKLQQNMEVLQVAVQSKNDENDRLRAEAVKARKRVLILEGKLLEKHSLVKGKNNEIQKLNGQPKRRKRKCASSISIVSSSSPCIRPAHTKPWFLVHSVCIVAPSSHTNIYSQ